MAALLAACSGGGTGQEAQSSSEKKPVSYFVPDPATAGRLTGMVKYRGKAPAGRRIRMDSDPECQAAHSSPPVEGTIVVGESGGLSGAFVYVSAGLEGKQFPPAEIPVQLDQKGCMFQPRVVAVRVGQPLRITNSDPVTHNIHPMPKQNREWNQGQPPGGEALERKFSLPEAIFPVKCNVHAWMRSYIAVLDHPYFTVTGSDGMFAIPDLPPGEYTVAVWHEKLSPQERKIMISAKGEAKADFEFQGE